MNWRIVILFSKTATPPIAFFWACTIISEAPGDGDDPIEVPLLRSMWLAKTKNRRVALPWKRDRGGQVVTIEHSIRYADGVTRKVKRPQLEIFEPLSWSLPFDADQRVNRLGPPVPSTSNTRTGSHPVNSRAPRSVLLNHRPPPAGDNSDIKHRCPRDRLRICKYGPAKDLASASSIRRSECLLPL